jgi:hypothetical protein
MEVYAMFHHMFEYLQDCIPAWVVSGLIVMMLFWITMSPFLMVAAATIWTLLFWTVALLWSFFKALRETDLHIERHE